uniref:PNPLA domain-containing protein n=1 Tax=Haptolina brevifila TaxID=156173 RepID=A0A7S2JDL7_9EUKA
MAGLKFFQPSSTHHRPSGPQHVEQTLLDSRVLEETILNLIGNITFLEAFDKTGRVLNITVTRSDGKAPPLLCNYLTTPHMLLHSASLASCSIPGVFEAVQLQMRGRNGEIEPYFKSGEWTWTDGGLQADLPKQRLTELFNVNQFIVSQVNPLAPLFVPVDGTGVRWLEECNEMLKSQLVGFVQGISKLWNGRLVRPGGFRGVDFVLQDYEGTVTIRPSWGLREMSKFLANFDDSRLDKYIRDGERATWPQIELIRSLCEIEYCLDEVATELQRTMAISRSRLRLAAKAAIAARDSTDMADVLNEDGESSTSRLTCNRQESMTADGALMRGKLPSYVSLAAYDGRPRVVPSAWPTDENERTVRDRVNSGHWRRHRRQ